MGVLAYLSMNKNGPGSVAEEAAAAAPATVPRENAVLVFGATGKTGKEVVQQLLASGRTVIAACRNRERAEQVLQGELGLAGGVQSDGGVLFVECVDISNAATLTPALFQGATQVLTHCSSSARSL